MIRKRPSRSALIRDRIRPGRRRSAGRKWWVTAFALGLLALGFLGCREEKAGLPNIVLVIGDDHGYPDFGFMGSPVVETPELDRIAQEGFAFTHGFNTSSSCRHSLLSLLTGLHPVQYDARKNQLRRQGIELPENQMVRQFAALPRLLAERGYVSFQAGKYWEAHYSTSGFDAGTTKKMPDKMIADYGLLPALSGGLGLGLGRSTMQPVIDFLDEEREAPFFLWFAPLLPHLPHNPKPRFLAPYEDLPISQSARLYYGNITRFDRALERLMEALEERDLMDNTLIVYLSDNGWDQPPRYARRDNSDGPRGKKSIYELGFRTPILFHWPRTIAAGRRTDQLVSTVDVFATLLDVAGIEPPPDREGRSLLPVLDGSGEFSRDPLIESATGIRPPPWIGGSETLKRASFLRTKEWRYVWIKERQAEALYRIRQDPRELRDVSKQNPKLARSFRKQIKNWRRRVTQPYSVDETNPPSTPSKDDAQPSG